MNSVSLVGRFTADPELRYTQSGVAVASFCLAVQRNYKNEAGEYEADFINCVAWRSTAEFIANHGGKGQRFGVSGTLQTRSYENKEGQRVYVTEVNVSEVSPIDWKQDETDTQPSKPNKPNKPNKPANNGRNQGNGRGGNR